MNTNTLNRDIIMKTDFFINIENTNRNLTLYNLSDKPDVIDIIDSDLINNIKLYAKLNYNLNLTEQIDTYIDIISNYIIKLDSVHKILLKDRYGIARNINNDFDLKIVNKIIELNKLYNLLFKNKDIIKYYSNFILENNELKYYTIVDAKKLNTIEQMENLEPDVKEHKKSMIVLKSEQDFILRALKLFLSNQLLKDQVIILNNLYKNINKFIEKYF